MSKRLEEIKKELELDWSDISYVVNQVDVKLLINRVEELEEENRRYREVINNIIEKAMLFGVDEQVFEAIKGAIRVLEGEE